jgi:hypothetical protein
MAPELGAKRLQAAQEIREAEKIFSAPLTFWVQQWERRDRSYDDTESIRSIHIQLKFNP